MLKPHESERLLNALCVRLGFCIPPKDQASLVEAPPEAAKEFAHRVIVAEGLDPEQMDRHLYRAVVAMAAEAYRRAAWASGVPGGDSVPSSLDASELPAGWRVVEPRQAAALEAELHRELPTSHPLHGRSSLRVLAHGPDPDDVLIADAEAGPVYVVHLTWTRETDPDWPWTQQYEDLRDLVWRWRDHDVEGDAG